MKVILLTVIWCANYLNKYATILFKVCDSLTATQQHGMDSIRTWRMVDGGVGTENLVSHCCEVPTLLHMLQAAPLHALEFLLG